MDTKDINITPDLLRSVEIKSILSDCDKNECYSYYSAFNKVAIDTKEKKQLEKYKAISLFCSLTSLQMNASDSKKPFDHIPNYTESDLNALSEIFEDIEYPELQARIADVLWLRLRKPEFAEIAINAYLASATNLEHPENWSQGYKRIERALRLASLFRRQNPDLFNQVTDYIEEMIKKYDGNDPLFLTIKLIGLLAEFNHGDGESYFNLSCRIASESHDNKDWHRAESAWEVGESWARKLNEEDKIHLVLKQLAETLAAKAINGDGGLASSKFMQQSIEVYRKVPDSRERRDELYKLLRDYQKKSLEQMTKIEGPEIDLTESVENSRKAVSGKSFEDAIFNLAFHIARPPKYEQVKKQAIENTNKFVFSSIVGSTHFDKDGLVVAEVPPMVNIGAEDDPPAIWAEMLRSVSIHHSLDVQGAIEPARREIYLEHNIELNDIFNIVKNNPFIPAGHEYLFAKGLYSGLTGDFVEATHLLVPQLENSLRYVLESEGVETTTLNTKGVQERIRIGAILEHETTLKIFSNDIVLDLQALLIERKYGNLRNEISHGLMSTNEFFQPAVVYLWWLIFRLCLTPFYKSWSSKIDNEEVSNTNLNEQEDGEESQKKAQ